MCCVFPVLLVAKIKHFKKSFSLLKEIKDSAFSGLYLSLALPLQVYHAHVHNGPQVGERLHHRHI